MDVIKKMNSECVCVCVCLCVCVCVCVCVWCHVVEYIRDSDTPLI